MQLESEKNLFMLIRLGYDMEFYLPAEVCMLAMLHVHPSRVPDLLEPDELVTEPPLATDSYLDSFGNRCTRFVAPAGPLRLYGSTVISTSNEPDAMNFAAVLVPGTSSPIRKNLPPVHRDLMDEPYTR